MDYWAFAWENDPIVAGLVSQSGPALSFNPNTKAYAQSIFFHVSRTMGCGGPHDDAETVVNCVQFSNASDVLAAAGKVPGLPTIALHRATFHPTVDDELVFSNYGALSQHGTFQRTPYLLDNTDFEAGWYKLSAYGEKIDLSEIQ